MSGPRRDLDREERALWQRVTESARPLGGRAHAVPLSDRPTGPTPDQDADAPGASPAVPPSSGPRARGVMPKPAGLDRRTEQRLRRGAIAIDARLDLHGLTQARAHAALRAFLLDAHKRGWRTVLVITGRAAADSGGLGPDSGADPPRGVLARQVPHWLAGAELRQVVSGFREAHRRHGGRGALYVRVRRQRRA